MEPESSPGQHPKGNRPPRLRRPSPPAQHRRYDQPAGHGQRATAASHAPMSLIGYLPDRPPSHRPSAQTAALEGTKQKKCD
ncbi:hypothetical protein LG3211_3400 [Lysobacter gummosus]|nr:hypothetical protein LG3211_3400 [Lysobacter gummosus]